MIMLIHSGRCTRVNQAPARPRCVPEWHFEPSRNGGGRVLGGQRRPGCTGERLRGGDGSLWRLSDLASESLKGSGIRTKRLVLQDLSCRLRSKAWVQSSEPWKPRARAHSYERMAGGHRDRLSELGIFCVVVGLRQCFSSWVSGHTCRAGKLVVILIIAHPRLRAKAKRKDTVTNSDGAQRSLSGKHADRVPLSTLQRPALATSPCLHAMLSCLNLFGWCAQREKLHPAGMHGAVAGEKRGNA